MINVEKNEWSTTPPTAHESHSPDYNRMSVSIKAEPKAANEHVATFGEFGVLGGVLLFLECVHSLSTSE